MTDELRKKLAKMTPEQKREYIKHFQSRKSQAVGGHVKGNSGVIAGSAKHNNIKPVFEHRPSIDIAKSFIELNVKTVIDADKESEMTSDERKKAEKQKKRRERKEKRRAHRLRNIFLLLAAVLVFAIASVVIWWNSSSEAVNPADKNEYQFTVSSGATVDNIADSLQKAGFIKNSLAFRIYARMNSITVHAGTFNLSPSKSMSSIAETLASNKVADITVMIPPGVNQKQLRETPVLSDSLTTNAAEAHSLLQRAMNEGATSLDTHEVSPVLRAYGIHTLPTWIAADSAEAGAHPH